MTTGRKVLFAVFVFLPVILIVFIEIELFSAMPMRSGGPDLQKLFQPGNESHLAKIGILFAFTVISNIVALIMHAVHLFKNKRIEDNQRIVWLLVLLFTGMIGQLIYFFKFILRSKPEEAVPSPAEPNRDFWNT